MKMISLKRCVLASLLLLSACVMPPAETPEEVLQKLEVQLATLPAAVVSADGRIVSYPDESLFAAGAVLPLPGGLDVLDPLLELLLQHPDIRAVGTVRSAGHKREYDQALAIKRQDILEKIFRNQGLGAERFQLTAVAAKGAPFEIELQPIIAETSAGAKL